VSSQEPDPDPGIDQYDFASEWESIWEDVSTDPREALPYLEDIVRRLLQRHAYVIDPDDPAARGEELEILTPYWAARQVADAVRAGADTDDGDIAQSIADLREIYESLINRVEGRAH
jgi:hypothetical protein